MTIAEWIEYREITKEQFARTMGVKLSTVYRWLNRETVPQSHAAARIVKISDGKVSYQDIYAPPKTEFSDS